MNSDSAHLAAMSTWGNLSDQEAVELAKTVSGAISQQVRGYARDIDPKVATDILRTNVCSVRLLYEALQHIEMPTQAQMSPLLQAARRRVHQGFPLESVLRAYRIGTMAMWEKFSVRLGDDSAAVRSVSQMSFRYIDHVSTAVEQAFWSEQEALLNSRRHSVHLFLGRLADGDPIEVQEIERLAELVNYPIDGPHLALFLSPDAPTDDTAGMAMTREIVAEFHRVLPNALTTSTATTVVMLVRGNSADNIRRLITSALNRVEVNLRYKLGISRPLVGVTGLQAVIHEAERALALGRIWDPKQVVYCYDDLFFYDLFKQGAALTEFVGAVLAPFIEQDKQGRTALVETLSAYYSENMNRKAAAHRLGIHPNTLDYRLKQAEKVSGVSIATGDYAFRFQLASRLIPIAHL